MFILIAKISFSDKVTGIMQPILYMPESNSVTAFLNNIVEVVMLFEIEHV